MKKIADILTFELEAAFEKAGYDKQYAKVTLSNRPDLCEYQCNGAMAAAKAYKKAPIMIANDVVEVLKESVCIEQVEAVNPGFINIILDGEFVASYLGKMSEQEKLGVEEPTKQKTIIVDYGGANVAKPLHVGHLRSAVIGESVKRIGKYVGHKMIGDVHLGDWGYQMGLVITELKKRKPELPYFDDQFEGEYPEESPFTITELEEIYPTASAYAKEHEDYKEEALQATFLLQNGHRGYTAIWKHIMNVSVADLKKCISSPSGVSEVTMRSFSPSGATPAWASTAASVWLTVRMRVLPPWVSVTVTKCRAEVVNMITPASATAPPISAPHLGPASAMRRRKCSFVFTDKGIKAPFAQKSAGPAKDRRRKCWLFAAARDSVVQDFLLCVSA